MLHRTILLLFTVLGLIQHAAGENESAFEFEHIGTLELTRMFEGIITRDRGAKFSVEGSKVSVTGGSLQFHERLRELKPVVDVPKIHVPSKFIRLRHIDLTFAAALVSEVFTYFGNKEFPLQAVPSPRTKQVFVFGELEDMRTAEVLLLNLDRFYASTSRGCGGLSLPSRVSRY